MLGKNVVSVPGMVFQERRPVKIRSDMKWVRRTGVCRMGLVKGRNRLLKAGFSQCRNKFCFKRENETAHYRSIMRSWILERILKEK